MHHWGGFIGALVSGTFPYLIAIFNLVNLVEIVKLFDQMRHRRFDDSELGKHLNSRGIMIPFCRTVACLVDTPSMMHPLGVLFGLGFDTATEVASLVFAGTSVAAAMPRWANLSLPILFAAGMCLLDRNDGSFMNFAYGWAISKFVRNVSYTMAITGLLVFIALYIGTLELARVLATPTESVR